MVHKPKRNSKYFLFYLPPYPDGLIQPPLEPPAHPLTFLTSRPQVLARGMVIHMVDAPLSKVLLYGTAVAVFPVPKALSVTIRCLLETRILETIPVSLLVLDNGSRRTTILHKAGYGRSAVKKGRPGSSHLANCQNS